ncbi:MAG: DUF3332 family protein [Bacteroidota bacterium]
MKQKLKKALVLVLMFGFITISTANCFGKFALTRKIYQFNDSIGGKNLVGRFLKTIVMYVFYILPVYGIGMFIDAVILNLIEFWTGNNLLGFNEYDENGMYVKTMSKGSQTLKLVYLDYGKKMEMHIKNGNKDSKYIFLQNKPNQIFQENNGKLEEVKMSSKRIGSKVLIKMAKDGKLQSSKVVDYKDYNDLNYSYNKGTF